MQLPSSYVLDREAIKLNAYRLICHFYANKEIARHTDPATRDSAIADQARGSGLPLAYVLCEFSSTTASDY